MTLDTTIFGEIEKEGNVFLRFQIQDELEVKIEAGSKENMKVYGGIWRCYVVQMIQILDATCQIFHKIIESISFRSSKQFRQMNCLDVLLTPG